jgi:uncharacterized protein (DUF2249 family)
MAAVKLNAAVAPALLLRASPGESTRSSHSPAIAGLAGRRPNSICKTPQQAAGNVLAFKTFDARPGLAKGEEPFPLIRACVDALTPGQGVTILAPFMPAPLIELLKSEGFSARMEHRQDGAWAVSFWKD